MVSRILTIDPEASVVELLAPGSTTASWPRCGPCVPLRHLLQLVAHAVLEATSRRCPGDADEADRASHHVVGHQEAATTAWPRYATDVA